MQFQVHGGKEMAEALKDLSVRMTRNVMIEALTDAAEPARARMQSLAPRAPGPPDIADNIVIGQVRGRGLKYAVGVGPARGFFYGYFLEFGARGGRMPAQPFIRTGFDATISMMLRRLSLSFWAAMTKRGFGRTRSASGTGTL
jgi:HK97 gp10 family phage protein